MHSVAAGAEMCSVCALSPVMQRPSIPGTGGALTWLVVSYTAGPLLSMQSLLLDTAVHFVQYREAWGYA